MNTPQLNVALAVTKTLAVTAASVLAVIVIAGLGACASVPPEAGEKMAVAEAAVQRANTATTSKDAARELQIAADKLSAARFAFNAKDYLRAEQLAEQAQIDSRVAELHAQTEVSRKAAAESREAARALGDEINRKTPR